jgi:hypothetical protein
MSIEIKAFLDATGEEEKQTKDGIETRYYAVVKLKKFAYEKNSSNLKYGTGDPWMTLKITSLDESVLDELLNKPKGAEIKIKIGE